MGLHYFGISTIEEAAVFITDHCCFSIALWTADVKPASFAWKRVFALGYKE